MKPLSKTIYFIALFSTIGILTIISNDIQRIFISSFTDQMNSTTIWMILLVVAVLCCLIGLVTLFRQVGKPWKATAMKVYMFLGTTFLSVGSVWIYLSISAIKR